MIIRRLRLIRKIWKESGLKGLLQFIFNYFFRIQEKKSITDYYGFLRYLPFGDKNNVGQGKTINWVIPDFGIGSGGHLNIFRMISLLEKRGFKCQIVIDGFSHFLTGEDARNAIREHFAWINADVIIGAENMKPASITVATSWPTAYAVRNFQGTSKKCYFVQDYEPYFYPLSSEYIFAEQTYGFGFYGITAGDWLASVLRNNFGMNATAIQFGVDTNHYQPLNQQKMDSKRVFFYARPVTPRRGFELGLLVLTEVSRHLPDVEFVLAGWEALNISIPFPHVNAGIVPLDKLPEIYSQCDAALVISFTNLSLLPLELMACGCPVVSNTGPNVEWLLTKDVAVLAEPTVDALSNAIIELLDNDEKRMELQDAGLKFVRERTWEKEADAVAVVFDELLSDFS